MYTVKRIIEILQAMPQDFQVGTTSADIGKGADVDNPIDDIRVNKEQKLVLLSATNAMCGQY